MPSCICFFLCRCRHCDHGPTSFYHCPGAGGTGSTAGCAAAARALRAGAFKAAAASPNSPVLQVRPCLPPVQHFLPRSSFDDSKGLAAIEVGVGLPALAPCCPACFPQAWASGLPVAFPLVLHSACLQSCWLQLILHAHTKRELPFPSCLWGWLPHTRLLRHTVKK